VIVRDLNFGGMSVLPVKTHAILCVDANTVLAGAISAQSLKPITRRNGKLREVTDPIELVKLATSDRP